MLRGAGVVMVALAMACSGDPRPVIEQVPLVLEGPRVASTLSVIELLAPGLGVQVTNATVSDPCMVRRLNGRGVRVASPVAGRCELSVWANTPTGMDRQDLSLSFEDLDALRLAEAPWLEACLPTFTVAFAELDEAIACTDGSAVRLVARDGRVLTTVLVGGGASLVRLSSTALLVCGARSGTEARCATLGPSGVEGDSFTLATTEARSMRVAVEPGDPVLVWTMRRREGGDAIARFSWDGVSLLPVEEEKIVGPSVRSLSHEHLAVFPWRGRVLLESDSNEWTLLSWPTLAVERVLAPEIVRSVANTTHLLASLPGRMFASLEALDTGGLPLWVEPGVEGSPYAFEVLPEGGAALYEFTEAGGRRVALGGAHVTWAQPLPSGLVVRGRSPTPVNFLARTNLREALEGP